MKKRIVFIFAIISIIVFSSYGCIKKAEKDKTANTEKRVVINQDNGLAKLYGFEAQEMEQKFFYLVRSSYDKTTTLLQLKAANAIDDIIPNYPSSWIATYVSVEITTMNNGKKQSEKSDNELLTKAQKELLSQTNSSSEVIFLVHYKAKNSVTGEIQHKEMNYAITVVPETKAEFIGGYNKMISYLESSSAKEIEKIGFNKSDALSISFTVNKTGKTENIILTTPSGYDKVDSLLIKLIKEMPQWNPAKNNKGNTVEQHFVFDLQIDRC